MASTELGFLALPQVLKGTPELSILPSLPPLDPFRRRNREATGDGALVPSLATGLVVSGERASAEAGGGPAGGGAGIGGAW